MIFKVLEAVFIESAYVSRESKMSISAVDKTGGALGASTVQAIVGMPGGLFVKFHNIWNLVPWANVKSARLVDAPAEVLDFVAREVADPVVQVRRSRPTQGPAGGPAPDLEAAVTGGLAAPPAAASGDDLLGLPARDAGGVLISAQPTSGPTIVCSACGASFIQGANHVCQKVAAGED